MFGVIGYVVGKKSSQITKNDWLDSIEREDYDSPPIQSLATRDTLAVINLPEEDAPRVRKFTGDDESFSGPPPGLEGEKRSLRHSPPLTFAQLAKMNTEDDNKLTSIRLSMFWNKLKSPFGSSTRSVGEDGRLGNSSSASLFAKSRKSRRAKSIDSDELEY